MSNADQNKNSILRFRDAINSCDENLANELIDSKAEFASLVSPEKLYGGSGYLSVVKFMRKSFSDIHWKIEDLVGDEDKVAVSWTCSGTHDGEFMGNPATGKKFEFSCMNFYYFNREGKIVNDVAAQGLIGLLQSLGMIQQPNM